MSSPPWRFGLLAAAGAVGTSSVAPALHDLALGLDVGPGVVAGVMSAYIVSYAAATIVAAQLIDAHGPRRVIRLALLIALVGTLVAGTATGGLALLLGRAVQGIGAGAVTMSAFDVARRTPNGIAATAAVITLGASMGPLVGGIGSQLISWRAAVLLPAVLHLTGFVALRVPSHGGGSHRIDRAGLLATSVGAAAGASGLQLAARLPALAGLLGVVAVGALGWACLRSIRRGGRVPPSVILTRAPLRRRAALAACIAATYFASLVIVPVALGEAGFGALAIGLLLLPPAVSGALSARFSGAIGARLGAWTDPVAAWFTLVVLVVLVAGTPVAAAIAIVVLATAYGMVQPRLLAAVSAAVQDGPATAIGSANLVLLLGGGAGAAAVGGLGEVLGPAVLLVLVGLVALRVTHKRSDPVG
jgi:MFS family permease